MAGYPVEIDGDEFGPVPERWIETDVEHGPSHVRIVAVSDAMRSTVCIGLRAVQRLEACGDCGVLALSETRSFGELLLPLAIAELGRFGAQFWCPLCKNSVEAEIGTPSVRSHILCEREGNAAVDDEVHVYRWWCRRHRPHNEQVLVPANLARESDEFVATVVAGRVVEVAAPYPVHAGGESR